MRAFLSIKYHADHRNREPIEKITAVLQAAGWETICVTRDIEGWGERSLAAPALMQRTFAAIAESDLVIVELSEKGVGLGIEAGYAAACQIPIAVIAPTGSDISTTLQGIAQQVGWYGSYDEIPALIVETHPG